MGHGRRAELALFLLINGRRATWPDQGLAGRACLWKGAHHLEKGGEKGGKGCRRICSV